MSNKGKKMVLVWERDKYNQRKLVKRREDKVDRTVVTNLEGVVLWVYTAKPTDDEGTYMVNSSMPMFLNKKQPIRVYRVYALPEKGESIEKYPMAELLYECLETEEERLNKLFRRV